MYHINIIKYSKKCIKWRVSQKRNYSSPQRRPSSISTPIYLDQLELKRRFHDSALFENLRKSDQNLPKW